MTPGTRFYAAGALRKVPVGGGPVVELCKTDLERSISPSPIFGASWSHKGQIVFANSRGGLWQVPAAGGTPAAVTKLQSEAGEVSHRLPAPPSAPWRTGAVSAARDPTRMKAAVSSVASAEADARRINRKLGGNSAEPPGLIVQLRTGN